MTGTLAQTEDPTALGSALATATDLVVISTDADGFVRTFNAAAERMLGWQAAQVVGKRRANEFLDPVELARRREELAARSDRDLSDAPDWEFLVGPPETRAWTVLHADGSRLSAVISFSVLRDQDGRPSGTLGIAHDITPLVRAKETALKAALDDAERARDLFESLATRAPTAVFLIDRKDGARFFNDQLEQLLGIAREELTGFGWLSRIHPDDRHVVQVAGHRTFDDGEITKVEVRFVRPDGSIRWAVIRSSPLHTADGEARSAVGTVTDTTQRKLLERALYCVATELALPQPDSSAFYREAALRVAELLSAEIAFIAEVSGDDARTVAVCIDGEAADNFAYSLAGTPCAEVMQRAMRFVPKDLRRLFPEDRIAAELAAESYAGVYLRDSAGRPFGLLAVASRHEMADAESTMPALHVFASRIAAELERERSEQSYRELFEFSPDAILMSDPGGGIVLANRAAETLFGYERDELVGRSMSELLFPAVGEAFAGGNLAADHTAVWPSPGAVVSMRRKDGTQVPCEVSLGPLATPRGAIVAAAVRDVSERRRAEEAQARFAADLARQVSEQTASLAAANRELDAFAASVSHDLRAPLRRIQGFAALLSDQLEARLNAEEAAWMRKVSESAFEMDELIRALLDAARSARVELHEERLDLTAMASEIMDDLLVDERLVHVRFHAAEVPAVLGDPVLVEQALRNLLSNAVKYSRPRPEAVIELGCDGTRDGRAVVFVRDNGVGFDMDAAAGLFDMFRRLHQAEEFEGNGVGLANVKRIVERHGGTVWAEAARDRGATFRFTLALATSHVRSHVRSQRSTVG